MLGKGDPKVTFLVGMVLSFPGVSYLTALDKIHHLNPGTVPTVLLVIGFCLMQQILLEIPLLGYVFAPESHAGHGHPVQRLDGPQRSQRRGDRRRRDRRAPGRQGSDHRALNPAFSPTTVRALRVLGSRACGTRGRLSLMGSPRLDPPVRNRSAHRGLAPESRR